MNLRVNGLRGLKLLFPRTHAATGSCLDSRGDGVKRAAPKGRKSAMVPTSTSASREWHRSSESQRVARNRKRTTWSEGWTSVGARPLFLLSSGRSTQNFTGNNFLFRTLDSPHQEWSVKRRTCHGWTICSDTGSTAPRRATHPWPTTTLSRPPSASSRGNSPTGAALFAPVGLQGCIPLVEEFLHAPMAELQKVRNVVT